MPECFEKTTCAVRRYINTQIFFPFSLCFVIVHSDCYIVKAVTRHAVLHGHMTSPLGRSALYCGLRSKFDIGRPLDPRFDYCNSVRNNCLSICLYLPKC